MNSQTFIAKAGSIFQDNAGRRVIGRQASGSGVDGGRLALLGAGDTRVFTKPSGRTFKDWNIKLLVDCSGSMDHGKGGDKVPMTAAAVHGLYHALMAARVGKVSADGFNMRLFPLKSLDTVENVQKELRRRVYGAYGNHDGYLLRKAADELSKAPEAGKMILVLSDGRPHCDNAPRCGNYGCMSDEKARIDLVQAVKETRQRGIIVLGMGILLDHLSEFYGQANSGAVMRLEELFSSSARLIERNIIRG